MKSSRPTHLRRLRLEAAEGPRIDLSGPTRRERDLLGERDVPAGALYGIQTLRAIENFCVSGIELHEFPTLVAGLATVKEAAALANMNLTFFPMHFSGMLGMPRRIYTYDAGQGWTVFNAMARIPLHVTSMH